MGQHALLFILTNVSVADELNFNRWYDREHLGDRIEIPGFTSSRRYESIGDARWKYLALYEAEGLHVFTSSIYKERLAAQSPWSKQVLPLFVDPQRIIAQAVSHSGIGFGSAVSIAAFRPRAGREEELIEKFPALSSASVEADVNLYRVRLFCGEPELSRPVAEYKSGGDSPIDGTHWFVIADGSSPESLTGIPGLIKTLPVVDDFLDIGTFQLRVGVDRGDTGC